MEIKVVNRTWPYTFLLNFWHLIDSEWRDSHCLQRWIHWAPVVFPNVRSHTHKSCLNPKNVKQNRRHRCGKRPCREEKGWQRWEGDKRIIQGVKVIIMHYIHKWDYQRTNVINKKDLKAISWLVWICVCLSTDIYFSDPLILFSVWHC